MADQFDPRELLGALERNRINYVVIGGLARVLHGADEVTADVDICPSGRADNLRRLARALLDLEARPVQGSSLDLDAEEPSLDSLVELETRFGPLTLVPGPADTRGYDDLRRRSRREPLGGGLRAPIADAGDLIRTLDGLNRPGDPERIAALRHITELERSFGMER